MANNFHMFKHKTNESLHIMLNGDFDGSSAYELINTLVDNQDQYYQIFVNVKDLNNIEPFGLDVLKVGLSEIRKQGSGVIFIGKNIEHSSN